MSDILKAIELYDLMASRLEKNGICLNQAKVYRDTIELMKTCSTLEEATLKIKNSDLYLAPSIALVKDKILARMNAAKEISFDDVYEIYEEKLSAIEKDGGEIYDAAYEVKAQNARNEYLNELDRFRDLYQNYLECIFKDGKLKTSPWVKEVKDIERFRKLIPCNDEAYDRFILAVSSGNVETVELNNLDSEWENIKRIKDEVISSGKGYLSDTKNVTISVLAPNDIDGHYIYITKEEE